jgi:hypothetical protein
MMAIVAASIAGHSRYPTSARSGTAAAMRFLLAVTSDPLTGLPCSRGDSGVGPRQLPSRQQRPKHDRQYARERNPENDA